jgi:ParB family transcriptional regulator, chromosome partitioning protein
MASKSKKLGLAADIFEQDIEGIIRKISIGDIAPNEAQPRTQFDETLNTLADSIKSEGLLQPIVVTKEGMKYRIIAGERRYRAAKIAGLAEIECRILHKNPKDTYRLAVIENLQRENLNAIDEASAFRKLKQEYGYNDSELAKIVGKSRNYVNEILSVAEIPSAWIEKARKAGIESKNLFIQFAQAVKSGAADTFLSAYESGAVKTVAAAKNFNKGQKARASSPGKTEAVSGLNCKGEYRDHRWKFFIDFSGPQAKGAALGQLEKNLRETVQKFFNT